MNKEAYIAGYAHAVTRIRIAIRNRRDLLGRSDESDEILALIDKVEAAPLDQAMRFEASR